MSFEKAKLIERLRHIEVLNLQKNVWLTEGSFFTKELLYKHAMTYYIEIGLKQYPVLLKAFLEQIFTLLIQRHLPLQLDEFPLGLREKWF